MIIYFNYKLIISLILYFCSGLAIGFFILKTTDFQFISEIADC
jgi:hypothetical protein